MTAPTEYASWRATISTAIRAAAATVEESETGVPVRVRHNTRSGWPVRHHSRAARGTGGGMTARDHREPS
jgi:hypothetical protein